MSVDLGPGRRESLEVGVGEAGRGCGGSERRSLRADDCVLESDQAVYHEE